MIIKHYLNIYRAIFSICSGILKNLLIVIVKISICVFEVVLDYFLPVEMSFKYYLISILCAHVLKSTVMRIGLKSIHYSENQSI